MQKFTLAICFILITTVLFITSINFKNAADIYFTNTDTTSYSVSKPKTMDEKNFLKLLDKKAADYNVTFYSYVNVYNHQIDDFVQTYFLSSNFKLKSPYITDSNLPIDNFLTQNLKIPNNEINYQMQPIDKYASANPNFSQIVLALNGNKTSIDNFAKDIAKDTDISIAKESTEFSTNFRLIVLLLLVLILTILFDEKNKMKEYNLLRLFGFTSTKILIHEFFNFFKFLCLIIFLAIITIFIIEQFTISLFIYFILYIYKTLLFTIFIISFIIIAIKFNYLHKKINYRFLKNYKSTTFETILLYLVKFIAILILINALYYSASEIKQTWHTIVLDQTYAKQFDKYITLPANISGKAINDELFKQLSQTDYNLYQNSVDDNDGIFIDSSQFNSTNQHFTSANKFLYTNSNYLQINPILANNQPILEDEINNHDIIILYPDNFNYHKLNTKEITDLTDIGYLKYDANQRFLTFNPKINTKNNELDDPIIVIENKLDANYHGNVLNSYILKNTNLKELLAKYDPTGFIKHPQAVNKVFKSQINILMQQLITNLRTLIISVIIIFVVIVFLISNYVSENKKLIFLKKIHGYSKLQIYNHLFITNAFIYILLCGTLILLKQHELIKLLFIILLIDFILITIIINLQERKANANQIRKN